MAKYILAIDQGTTSSRAIIIDHDQKIVKIAQKEIRNFFPSPGWVEQDAGEIWQSVLDCIHDVFKDGEIRPQDITSFGITNQRETTVLWDRKTGEPVYNAIVWQSRQTSEIVERYKKAGVEPLIKEKTGLLLDPYFSATKLNWIFENVEGTRDNKDLLFGTVDSWLLYKLTKGKVHATDVTNASRTLLFNIHTLNWDEELLKIFDIPSYILPEIRATSGSFGTVDPEWFFGCEPPITSMVGDQQAALFGESCFEKNDIKNTYGTGGFLLINAGDQPIISKNGLLSTVAWKIGEEVKYALEGSIFVSGSLLQWMRDGLHLFEKSPQTEAMANAVEDNGGVIIVPAFTGLGAPYWNSECKGAIFGLTRGVNENHIARAGLEAMAYQSKDLVDVMEEDINGKIREIKVDGGGSNNKFLLQFQADILGIPVVKFANSETTVLGAARLSGLATGFYTMDDFREENKTVYEPKMDKEKVDELYAKWKKAVESCMRF